MSGFGDSGFEHVTDGYAQTMRDDTLLIHVGPPANPMSDSDHAGFHLPMMPPDLLEEQYAERELFF